MILTRVERLARLLQAGAAAGLYTGAALALVRREGVVATICVGHEDDAGSGAITPATLWDLASVTKPVCTATLLLHLAERGEFHLRDEVDRFLPEVRPTLRGVTLHHLLTHTSGLPAWRQLHSQGWSPEEAWERVFATGRLHAIGSRFVYSDLGYMLLGRVIEAVTMRPLDEIARQTIFEPLGMERTGFRPRGTDVPVAATRCPDRGRVLRGEVHDGNCHTLGGVAGHAGLFASLDDLARYAHWLAREGEGADLLGPLAIRAMLRPQIDPAIGGMTWGWFARPNGMLPAGDFLPPDTVGHTGFTGTSLVIAPSADLAAILLTNRVYHDRPAGEFLRFRRRAHNAIAACLARSASDPPAT